MGKETMKFYSNYKDGKFFISAKNEKDTWFSLWKSKEFNSNLYLDNSAFKGGKEINKDDLKLLEDKKDCRVLVFKTAEKEKEFCINKAEIAKRKADRKKSDLIKTMENLAEVVQDLFKNNPKLQVGDGLVKELLEKAGKNADCLEEINDDDLPF